MTCMHFLFSRVFSSFIFWSIVHTTYTKTNRLYRSTPLFNYNNMTANNVNISKQRSLYPQNLYIGHLMTQVFFFYLKGYFIYPSPLPPILNKKAISILVTRDDYTQKNPLQNFKNTQIRKIFENIYRNKMVGKQ